MNLVSHFICNHIIWLLSVISFANIFFPILCVVFLFSLWFPLLQKLFSLIRSHLIIFIFILNYKKQHLFPRTFRKSHVTPHPEEHLFRRNKEVSMKTPYFSFLSKTEIPFPYDWIDTLPNTFLSRMRWSNNTLKRPTIL